MTSEIAPVLHNTRHHTFPDMFRTWAKVALLSFGGPAGQISVMHRVIVVEKKWVTEDRFLRALNFCMLLPGPEAQQLATYLGWLTYGVKGGLTAGLLFIAPGMASIMALSWLYVLFGHLPATQTLFLGLKAAILAIILEALLRLTRRALKQPVAYVIASLSFIAMFFFQTPFPLVIVTAGMLGVFFLRASIQAKNAQAEAKNGQSRSKGNGTFTIAMLLLAAWLLSLVILLALLGWDNVFTKIGYFFSKMALVTFGGAYAVLSYVAQEAVQSYHWLSPEEMLDGLGMAETTPGPLIMVVQHIAFLASYREPGAIPPLLAGTLGGLLATWVTFAPCFLWIFLFAPIVEKLQRLAWINAALAGITAAIVGTILNLALWFALHLLFRESGTLYIGQLVIPTFDMADINMPAFFLVVLSTISLFLLRLSLFTTLGTTIAAAFLLRIFMPL